MRFSLVSRFNLRDSDRWNVSEVSSKKILKCYPVTKRMTSTNQFIGIGEGCRFSSRVLKPPGGGSSDIFGEGGNSPQPRVVARQHLKSSLFADPPSAPAPSTNGNLEADTNGTLNGTTNGTANGHATSPKGNKNEGRNPVTGEGYTGDERDSSHAANTQPKQRVPPGGYTTPLW